MPVKTVSRAGASSGRDPRGLRRLALPAFARLPTPARRSLLHAFGKYAPWEDGFDFTPPTIGGDEFTGPPDFVGIGVQKAGTSWWYDALQAHPGVYSRDDLHKERHFFDRFATKTFDPSQCSQYHGWFPRLPGTIAGEWTPDYINLPWVPPLLAQAAPRTRLLIMVRDPVERLRSGLAHLRRDGHKLTTQAYADAIARGFYEESLRRWAVHFSPAQMLVLQYEHCVADPEGQLARTFRFLGLDPFRSSTMEDRVNVTTRAVTLDEGARRRLAELYAADSAALSQRFPEVDLERWPSFRSVGTP
jgi:hypothetical protein